MKLRIWFFSVSFLFIHLLNAQLPVGSKAPSIRLPDVAGKVITLDSLKGQWVLVDFWASWCGPCRHSNDAIQKQYADWKAKGIEVLGVSLDDDRREWIKAIKKDKISWLQVNCPPKFDHPVIINWQFERIPTSYLIDPTGTVQAVNPDPKRVLQIIAGK